jgi:hypothetical protein
MDLHMSQVKIVIGFPIEIYLQQGVVVHTATPTTQEEEGGESKSETPTELVRAYLKNKIQKLKGLGCVS